MDRRDAPRIGGPKAHTAAGAAPETSRSSIEDITSVPDVTLERLLKVGRSLVAELDLDGVLNLVLETARELTGARYAAIGVLAEDRNELGRFLTLGISEQARELIGAAPTGKGLLGALIERPMPLRLSDIGQDERSYGFPSGHPHMKRFLGVPITIRGEVWGNIYLADEHQNAFTKPDQDALVILADWAAIAIDNARHYEASERRGQDSERAARHLRLTRDVAVAIGRETDLERVLELVVNRAQALVGARAVLVWLSQREALVLRAMTGGTSGAELGMRVEAAGSQSNEAMRTGRALREAVRDSAALAGTIETLGSRPGEAALIVPLLTHGTATGVLVALGASDGASFSEEHEALLETFAAGAGTAVALAKSVERNRLEAALQSAEAERTKWARELHDETLQTLAGLRVLLGGALRRNEQLHTRDAVGLACENVDDAIENLRSIITELRPATLDEMGLRTALEALMERQARSHPSCRLRSEIGVLAPLERERRLDPGLENAVYRIVQESLTNINKHAKAANVWVTVRESDTELFIEVRDDGVGFDPSASRQGFGLTGVDERVGLANGTLSVSSGSAGTLLVVRLPLATRGNPASTGPVRADAQDRR